MPTMRLGATGLAVVETAQLVQTSGGGGGTWPAGGSPRAQPRTVAVKRLKPNVIESEDDVLCFIQEARLLVNLQVGAGGCPRRARGHLASRQIWTGAWGRYVGGLHPLRP